MKNYKTDHIFISSIVSISEKWLVNKTDHRSRVESRVTSIQLQALGPVSRKPRKRFGPAKPFLVNLYLKTERCIRLKLLV